MLIYKNWHFYQKVIWWLCWPVDKENQNKKDGENTTLEDDLLKEIYIIANTTNKKIK